MRKRQRLSPQRLFHSKRASRSGTDGISWVQQLLPGSIGKNATIDSNINRSPLVLVAVGGGIIFMILLLQLAHLQVVQGERMRGIAEGNRIRERITYAPRGQILDRNGIVLADNTASFQLSATPYLLPDDEQKRQAMYAKIARITAASTQVIAAKTEAKGINHVQPVLVLENIAYKTALKLEYVLPELTGFSLDAVPSRQYKTEAGLAHILGYVGRASEEDLAARPKLHPLDFVGKRGIEAQYDQILRGQNGIVKTEIDALGRPLRTLREVPAIPGQDIRLTIDYKLQKRFAAAIKEQMEVAGVKRAAGVLMNPNNGEILAMVSFPSYNNNLFAQGISSQKYQQLLENPLQPMLNRVVAGGYPSGSVIKPITLIGALETNTVTEDTIIVDDGALTVYSQYDPSVSYTFLGWRPSGLGPMNARRAIAMSSNIYFYTVAGGYRDFEGMGIDNLVKYYQMFGLGSETGVDLPIETAGRVPTPKWKQEYYGQPWFVGDTYNLAIGQGSLLVSPLQMARAHSAIVNGGALIQPQLYLPADREVVAKPPVDPYHYQIVQEGMRQVLGGTTCKCTFADVPVPVAGKSGTAETNPGERKSHAWYSAYAPYGDPEILGVVLLEEGQGGSQYAAPAIAEAFEWYFKKR